MRKIHDLFRLLAVRLSGETQDTPSQQESRPKPGGCNAVPGCADEASTYRTIELGPSDAARRLWCNARHF